jgi:protein O-GlcNAc transferase
MPNPAGSESQRSLWERSNDGSHDSRCAAEEKHRSQLEEYERSIQQNPRNADAYLALATGHKVLGQYARALSVLKEGVDRCAPSRELYQAYIKTLRQCNRIEQAMGVADQGLVALSGSTDAGVIRIAKRLSLPVLYHTQEEVDSYRQRFQSELAALCRETTLDTEADRLSAFQAVRSWVNFYLAYQGRNDRVLQQQYGRLIRRIMAASYPQWTIPREMPPLAPGEKLRVGYVSSCFYHHSVMKSHLGWLQEHDKNRIDLYTYHVGKLADSTTGEVERGSVRFSHMPDDLARACEAIIRDRLHVLVFLDIGMNRVMGLMGALRLAPVQCVTWGHPVTSGLDTIDYFISSSLMEPDDADGHYCERLIRLPGVGVCYRRPIIPRAILWRTRGDFGLRDDAVVYLSCQSLQKYLPEHDHVFAEIAGRVPAAQFVFLGANELVAADFRSRLDRAFSIKGLSAGKFCVILPMVNQLEFLNLNLKCDVYLDTFTWSGCNTTFEAIACDLPVVTMAGKFMRGRHSYAILTQLGVTETIAHDEAAYVELAVRLGVDGEWRKSIVARMKEQSPRVYGDRTCVRALEGFYERIVAERLLSRDRR